jgi:GT2 family glycosyltransferase
MTSQVTVAIISWLLEERLMKTLSSIPKTTSLPLNLCLNVQGAEQISPSTKQAIINSASGFVNKDIYFTENNRGIAKPRSENLIRAATTPYIFMSDNDMDYQPNTIDEQLKFMESNPSYGIVDVVNNQVHWHRQVEGKKVKCIPLNFDTQRIVDVDLLGGTSLLIRREVALTPNIIDTNYYIGSWDFDFIMNVRKAGWKVATLVDKNLVAFNDKSMRSADYKWTKLRNPIIEKGRRLFESKWGFSCMDFPVNSKLVSPQDDTIVISRAIYHKLSENIGMGMLSENRLLLMQKYFINSLKSQTDPLFKIYIIVGQEGNETTERIKSLNWGSLDVNFIYTSGDISEWKSSVEKSGNWGRETDKGSPEDIARRLELPTATIMARLDIDDWVAPGWISHMKHMAKTHKEPNFLINYQVFGQAPDGQIYKFYAPHRRNRTSPFIAIVQRSKHKISLYQTVHLQMGKLFDTVYTIPPSYAYMVIHGENRSNQVYTMDKFLYEREHIDNMGKIPPQQESTHKPVIEKTVTVSNTMQPNVSRVSWRDRVNGAKDRLNNEQTGVQL